MEDVGYRWQRFPRLSNPRRVIGPETGGLKNPLESGAMSRRVIVETFWQVFLVTLRRNERLTSENSELVPLKKPEQWSRQELCPTSPEPPSGAPLPGNCGDAELDPGTTSRLRSRLRGLCSGLLVGAGSKEDVGQCIVTLMTCVFKD